MLQNIWKYRLDTAFGPNKNSKEQYLRQIIKPRIEAAYKNTKRISPYYKSLLYISITQHETYSSSVNTRWLTHLKTAVEAYDRIKMRDLHKNRKLTEYFKKISTIQKNSNTGHQKTIQHQNNLKRY